MTNFRNWCTSCQRSSLVVEIRWLRLRCQRCGATTNMEALADVPPLGRNGQVADCQTWARRKFQESGLYKLALERGWWPSQEERWLYGDPLWSEPRWSVLGPPPVPDLFPLQSRLNTFAGIPVLRNDYMPAGTVAVVEGSVVCADVDFNKIKALFKNLKP